MKTNTKDLRPQFARTMGTIADQWEKFKKRNGSDSFWIDDAVFAYGHGIVYTGDNRKMLEDLHESCRHASHLYESILAAGRRPDLPPLEVYLLESISWMFSSALRAALYNAHYPKKLSFAAIRRQAKLSH